MSKYTSRQKVLVAMFGTALWGFVCSGMGFGFSGGNWYTALGCAFLGAGCGFMLVTFNLSSQESA